MKLYLAAPYAGRDILKDHKKFWEDAGHEVDCGWLRGTRPLGEDSYGVSFVSTDGEVTQNALMDLTDIDSMDAVIHYTAGYLQSLDPSLDPVLHNLHSGGRHVETGYALARYKPVIVLGPQENIFQRGLCLQADTLEDALEALQVIQTMRPK